jgi:hypothetical protein
MRAVEINWESSFAVIDPTFGADACEMDMQTNTTTLSIVTIPPDRHILDALSRLWFSTECVPHFDFGQLGWTYNG